MYLGRWVCMSWDKFLNSEMMKSTDLKYTIQWILINVPPWVTTTWIKIYHHRYESSLMLSSGTNVPPFWPSFSVACLYVLKTWTPDVWTLMWLAFFVTQLTVFEIHPYQYGNHYFIIFLLLRHHTLHEYNNLPIHSLVDWL